MLNYEDCLSVAFVIAFIILYFIYHIAKKDFKFSSSDSKIPEKYLLILKLSIDDQFSFSFETTFNVITSNISNFCEYVLNMSNYSSSVV